jgi:GNAT superfamily N-acetyltransferase
MRVELVEAASADADAIAALHAESWRSAYRGMLPDDFLDHGLLEDRQRLWRTRLGGAGQVQWVAKAMLEGKLAGFACVLPDVEPHLGPRLDNLHVRPELKRTGIGHRLFTAAREWSSRARPGRPMHLWVLESNQVARSFYEREGGRISQRIIRDVVPGLAAFELRYDWPAQSHFA